MQKNKRIVYYDIALLICIYLLCSSIPFARFVSNTELAYWLSMGTRLLFFPFAIYFIIHDRLSARHLSKPCREDIFLIPFLFLGLSNFMVCWIMGTEPLSSVDGYAIFKSLIECLLVALSEELIFRTLLFNEMDKSMKLWKATLFSSLIFGICHLANISSVASIVPVLIQSGYSFVLGLLLSLSYHYKKNIVYIVIIHFLFNFLNNGLVTRIYDIPLGWQYYVINVCFAVIFVIYAIFLLLLIRKKKGSLFMIKGIIFDLDGVIVSTDHYHYLAWKAIADKEGIYFDEKINNRLRGVSRMASLDIVLERANRSYTDDEKKALAEEKNNIYVDSLSSLKKSDLLPTVLDTLIKLKERGIKIAIGSSSKNTKTILKQIEIIDMFDSIIDGNDITHSKPDPEVFIKARESLGLEEDEVLVVEDAEAGIDAANAGNMKSCGINGADKYKKSIYKLDTLSDLLNLL